MNKYVNVCAVSALKCSFRKCRGLHEPGSRVSEDKGKEEERCRSGVNGLPPKIHMGLRRIYSTPV